jgi:anti-anti-sigma factor
MFAPSASLFITTERGRTTVRFARPTRLTEETVGAVGHEFEALLSGPAPHLRLDLGAVDFLSSVALSQLITLNRKVQAARGSLVLTNLKPGIYKVFLMARLDRVLDIDPPAQAPAS